MELKQALSQQAGPVVMLDAASLRVFDSSAVAVLLELRRQLRAAGQDAAGEPLAAPAGKPAWVCTA